MGNRVQYSESSILGKAVVAFAEALETARAAGQRADDMVTAGMAADTFTALAAEIGGGISAVDAQALWTIVRNARTAMDGAPIVELIGRLDRRT